MPMTEAEWLACDDPVPMLACPEVRRSDRRERLVACACCRRFWHLLADGSRRAIEVTERYADGHATSDDLWDAYHTTECAVELFGHMNRPVHRLTFPDDQFDVFEVVDHAAEAVEGESRMAAEWVAQAKIVREVCGNPFRTSARLPPSVLAWNDATIPRIAEGIYAERAFERVPILHDALLDAGCNDEALLSHCRNSDGHVRGCWALDLILGRQ
jgi:hypothetical protein